jgi:anti-anti-sigma factor
MSATISPKYQPLPQQRSAADAQRCFIAPGEAAAMSYLPPFALQEEAPDASTCVIAVRGEGDMSTAVKFNESFFSAARAGVRRVVADLSGVQFIDTTMLTALVVGHRRMVRDRGSFAVVCDAPRVARVLEITGLGQILKVFENRDAALAHVREAG